MVGFKYQSHLSQFSNCPPFDCECKELMAYRFVFEALEHENNFAPVLLIKPGRINSPRFQSDAAKCSGYSISLFDTLQNAQNKYLTLRKSVPNISATLGTHIAEGLIGESDGRVSKASRDGHFDLYEFEHTDLKKKFKIVTEAMVTKAVEDATN